MDAPYSGSCKDATEEWIIKTGGKVNKADENMSICMLKYFHRDAYLELQIFTCCKADEICVGGSSKGSAWTSTFFGKGYMLDYTNYGHTISWKD